MIAALPLLIVLATPADRIRSACMGDWVRLCIGEYGDRNAVRCLRNNRTRLSPACTEALR